MGIIGRRLTLRSSWFFPKASGLQHTVKKKRHDRLYDPLRATMKVKRVARSLKSVPNAQCFLELVTSPKSINFCTGIGWASRSTTCRSTRWRSCTMEKCRPGCLVTKHLMRELGYNVNHVDRQYARAWASKRDLEGLKNHPVEKAVSSEGRQFSPTPMQKRTRPIL